MRVVVIGAGVAGCAAAVAAAEAGADTVLIEARLQLGGVAVAGGVDTICGCCPIDARTPDLLEPASIQPWLAVLAARPPVRLGRVWLWPTEPARLQHGLARRLQQAGVLIRCGMPVLAAATQGPRRLLAVQAGGSWWEADRFIDASGGGQVTRTLVAGPPQKPIAWPAVWGLCALPPEHPLAHDFTPARNALYRQALANPDWSEGLTSGAIALTPQALGLRLAIDLPPDTTKRQGAHCLERLATSWGLPVLSLGLEPGIRDHGRPPAQASCAQVFSQQQRGAAWAAWPMELHRSTGITWRWPPGDRYGVSWDLLQLTGGPHNLWLAGKGLPVDVEAAAALRVIGTGLAVGHAVGLAVACQPESQQLRPGGLSC